MSREHLSVPLGHLSVPLGEPGEAERERMRDFVSRLPEASGTFSGTFDPGVVDEAMFRDLHESLFPVGLDTGDKPNPAAEHPPLFFTVAIGDRGWTLPVDHVDPQPGTNRVTLWCRRPGIIRFGLGDDPG